MCKVILFSRINKVNLIKHLLSVLVGTNKYNVWSERIRDRQRERGIQTDRQGDIHRHIDRQTARQRNTKRQTGRQRQRE